MDSLLTKKTLSFGIAVGLASLIATATATAAGSGDPQAGKQVFQQRCAVCHGTTAGDRSHMGPTLHGVVGRKAGSVSGYKYSTAMANSGLVWSKGELTQYLQSPQKVVRGNKMGFGGLSAAQEPDLIAYLETLR